MIIKTTKQSLVITSIFVLVIAMCLFFFGKTNWIIGFLIGFIWAALNFLLIAKFVSMSLENNSKNIFLLIFVKFPLMYGLLLFVFYKNWFPLYSLLLGLSSTLILLGVFKLCMKKD